MRETTLHRRTYAALGPGSCLMVFSLMVAIQAAWACDWTSRIVPRGGETRIPTPADIDTTEHWTLPVSAASACDYNSECQPTLTADGKTLLYDVGRVNGPTPDGVFHGHETQVWNIYIADWNDSDERWDNIRNAGPVINPGRGPSVSPGGDTLYFNKDNDIYVAYRNPSTGDYDLAELIGPPVSDPEAQDFRPHITPDGNRLYFSSNRMPPPEPWGGGYDLYVALRNPITAEWDSVRMLGPGINTPDTESSPFPSADETKLYFTDFPGYRYGPKYGEFDLYVSTWDPAMSEWGVAKLVPPPVNYDMSICSGHETPEGRLYLGSEIWEGVVGEEDLMVATRLGSGATQEKPEADPPHMRSEWERVGELAGARNVYCLVEDNEGFLYAGTVSGALENPHGVVFRSTDAGGTWSPTTPLSGAIVVHTLLVDGITIFAGTYPNGDVFRTSDGGLTWIPTADLSGATAVRALLKTSDGTIIAGTSPDSSKVFRFYATDDSGDTWRRLGTAENATGGIYALYETEDGVLFAGGRHYIDDEKVILYQSLNQGMSWQFHHLPIEHERLTIGQIIFFRELSDGTLWTGGWAHGPQGVLARSYDQGFTWEYMPTLYRLGEDTVSVARFFDMVEAMDGSLILGCHPGPDSVCWRSMDGGDSWQLMDPLPGAREALCLLRTSDGQVFAGTSPRGDVFRWTPSNTEKAEELELHPSIRVLRSGHIPAVLCTIHRDCKVRVDIYDLAGHRIETLYDDHRRRGAFMLRWDGRNRLGNPSASGAYVVSLKTENATASERILLER